MMSAVAQTFRPSLELNGTFYEKIVAPILGSHPHAAALLGWGSDILGYDTDRSTDHGWGPRLQIFVDETDLAAVRARVDADLPDTFDGWPVRYGWDQVESQHRVDVLTLGDWLTGQLGFDPRQGVASLDWLTVSQQQLLGVVRGAVYADPERELAAVRARLEYFPRDVWLWLLAAQWHRVSQEEAFVGRTAEVGDELGSRLLAGRQARDLMCLSFLQERTYWPYTKWFGTAFARLPGAGELEPLLGRAVSATDHSTREDALAGAYELLGRRHNESGLTAAVDPTVRPFHTRPFRVLMADRFAGACRAAIEDPWLRELALVGSVDQFADSTDVLSSSERTQYLRGFFERL